MTDTDRYHRAVHCIQAGSKLEAAKTGEHHDSRTGINIAFRDHASIVELLVAKGLIARDAGRATRQHPRHGADVMTDPAHPHLSAGYLRRDHPDQRPSIAELQLRYEILARGRQNDDARRDFALDMLDSAPVLLEIAAAALAALPELKEEFEPGLTCMHGGVGERLAAALAKVRP